MQFFIAFVYSIKLMYVSYKHLRGEMLFFFLSYSGMKQKIMNLISNRLLKVSGLSGDSKSLKFTCLSTRVREQLLEEHAQASSDMAGKHCRVINGRSGTGKELASLLIQCTSFYMTVFSLLPWRDFCPSRVAVILVSQQFANRLQGGHSLGVVCMLLTIA